MAVLAHKELKFDSVFSSTFDLYLFFELKIIYFLNLFIHSFILSVEIKNSFFRRYMRSAF